MINLKNIDNIYIAPGYTDMRKSIDSCSAIVQHSMYLDSLSKSIFIFCNKKKNTIQILEWDGNGFWLNKKKMIGKDKYTKGHSAYGKNYRNCRRL